MPWSEAFAGEVQKDAVQIAADTVERAPEVGRLVMRIVQDDCGRVERLAEAYAAPHLQPFARRRCLSSSSQRSRRRVTFVMCPSTPCPVPSKKRQMFMIYQTANQRDQSNYHAQLLMGSMLAQSPPEIHTFRDTPSASAVTGHLMAGYVLAV